MTTEPHTDLYHLLFQNISDGAIVADPNGFLLRINPSAAGMLRVVPDECLGKQCTLVFEDHPILIDLLGSCEHSTQKMPLPGQRTAVGISHLQGDGSRLVLLQDITERDELASRRDQLVRNIAHDLRSPISAITGFGELIGMSGPMTAEQQHYLTRLRQTARKLSTLVDTLVDLAWVESGMPMDRLPVQMDQILPQAVSELAEEAQKKAIAVQLEIIPPIPTVIGDSMRLKQVVFNVLDNAITYSPAGQTVDIQAMQADHEFCCTVVDRGIGISETDLPLIFDRLYRSQDETVRDIPGGGIGLTMARLILRRHGGTIHAESVYGQGSTFTFTLPTAEG